MAGAFSGHLLSSFTANPQTPSSSSIVNSGAMSFDARQHGSPFPFSNTPCQPLSLPAFGGSPFPFTVPGPSHISEETATKIATLQAKLNKRLGPEYISQRPGPAGGPKLTYAEGWKIINLANEVFGFNGWSSSIVNLTTDFVDWNEEGRRFNVGVTAIVRVTLRDGAYHEDVGYGMLENAKGKAAALDKCKKEAITDALKRTLRNFGNLLGNCLYDKSYAQEVVKIKVPPAKFDKSELYRRPEFEESKPDPPVPAPNHPGPPGSTERNEQPQIKREAPTDLPETPITYIPRHLRQEMAAAAQHATPTRREPIQGPSTSTSSAGPSDRKPPSVDAQIQKPPMGLHTPIQTPVQRPPLQRRAVEKSSLVRNPLTDRQVTFSEMPPPRNPIPNADARKSSSTSPPPAVAVPGAENEDAYPLSTQEDVFFATVDLGEGDLGRPIDFEEGMGGVSVMDDSMVIEEAQVQVQVPKAIERVPSVSSLGGGGTTGGSGVGARSSSVNGQPGASISSSASARPTPPNSGAGPSRPGQPNGPLTSMSASTSAPSASTSTRGARPGPSSTDNKRAGSPSMGGFHFPPGMKSAAHVHPQPPKPLAAAVSKPGQPSSGNGNGNALKRSADVMQGSSSSSSLTAAAVRTPIQGMGLAQRQHQQQQQQHNAATRRPPDSGDGGDVKRVRH